MRSSFSILLSLASAAVVASSAYASAMFAECNPNKVHATAAIAVILPNGEDRRCVGCHHANERHMPALAALRITPGLLIAASAGVADGPSATVTVTGGDADRRPFG